LPLLRILKNTTVLIPSPNDYDRLLLDITVEGYEVVIFDNKEHERFKGCSHYFPIGKKESSRH